MADINAHYGMKPAFHRTTRVRLANPHGRSGLFSCVFLYASTGPFSIHPVSVTWALLVDPNSKHRGIAMANATLTNLSCEIGETAGAVWRVLDERGSASLTELVKQVDAPRDTVMQAIGWLAREEKVALEQDGRKKIVTLV